MRVLTSLNILNGEIVATFIDLDRDILDQHHGSHVHGNLGVPLLTFLSFVVCIFTLNLLVAPTQLTAAMFVLFSPLNKDAYTICV